MSEHQDKMRTHNYHTFKRTEETMRNKIKYQSNKFDRERRRRRPILTT